MKNKILSLVLAVLLVMTIIPFSAINLHADAALVSQTRSGSAFSDDFEPVWSSKGNYAVKGYNVESATFDGVSAKKIYRNSEDVKAVRSDGDVKTSFDAGLYAYGSFNDNDGNKVLMGNSCVIGVNYYYDTTNRVVEDGRVGLEDHYMYYNQIAINNPAAKNGKDFTLAFKAASTETIKANEWGTVYFYCKNDTNASKFETGKDFPLHQYKFYVLTSSTDGTTGLTVLPNMYSGDVFYLGDVTYYSYDPLTVAKDTRYVDLYPTKDAADQGDPSGAVASYTMQDLDTVTFPAFDETWRETYSIPSTYDFLGWRDATTNVLYQPRDTHILTEQSDKIYYADYKRPADIKFYSDDTNYTTQSWKTNETYDLPAGPTAPTGYAFTGWKESLTGNVLNAGDAYTLTDDSVSFTAQFAQVYKINFYSDDGKSSVVSTIDMIVGGKYTLPAACTPPEGKVFASWKTLSGEYAASSSYTFAEGDSDFVAQYVTPENVYYSSTGTIDGVTDTVYSSFDDALAATGKAGIIVVSGDLALPRDSKTVTASELTIKGFDANATITLNADGNFDFTGNGSKITINDITVVRGSGTNDENHLTAKNAGIIFGSGCKFVQGTRTTNGSELSLFMGGAGNFSGDQYYEFNSDNIGVTYLAPTAGYSSGTTVTGNFNAVINAGSFGNIFGVSRNGNHKDGKSTFNGNASYIINGGNIGGIKTGCNIGGKINGDVSFVINGGNITDLVFGNDVKAAPPSVAKNISVVVNSKEITNGGYNVPLAKDGVAFTDESAVNNVLVYNNSELVAKVPTVSTADYTISAEYGKVTPVFTASTTKFKATSDDTSLTDIYVDGTKAIVAADGTFNIAAGTHKVTFGSDAVLSYKVTYKNGDTEIDGGKHTEGQEFVLPTDTFTKADYILEAWTWNGTEYDAGTTFTMPASDVVLEAKWYSNTTHIFYVSNAGVDTNKGYKESSPLKTFAAAFAKIGDSDGTIIVMDGLKEWPTTAHKGMVTVTGKDPVSGKVYTDAAITRNSGYKTSRPALGGPLTLTFIKDYLSSEVTEFYHPISLIGYKFVLGENAYSYSSKGTKGQTQILTGNSSSGQEVVINGGNILDFNIINWNPSTITGDLKLTINKGIESCSEITLGGDSGSATKAEVKGSTFITVNGSQLGSKIVKGGTKNTSITVLNGLQVVLNDSNWTLKDYNYPTGSAGSYTNNGAEYVVNAVNVIGSDVQSTTLGKVMLTIPEGYKAVVTDKDGVSNTYSTTQEVTLNEGASTVAFSTDAISNVKFGDGNAFAHNVGSIITIPDAENKGNSVFVGWEYADKLYMPGDSFVVPNEPSIVFNPFYYDATTGVNSYVDAANGSDDNTGLDSAKPAKTINGAAKYLASFNGFNKTINIIGDYTAGLSGNFELPKLPDMVTYTGTGVLAWKNELTLQSNTTFKNITLNVLDPWKFMNTYGFALVFDTGVVKASGSNSISIHAGRYNEDMSGDSSIVLKSGEISGIKVGPYYIPGTTTGRKFDGNVYIDIDGASVGGVGIGDGYGTTNGTFVMNGNVIVNVKSGVLSKFDGNGFCNAYNNVVIINNTDSNVATTATEFVGPTYILNLKNDITASYVGSGIFNVSAKSYTTGADSVKSSDDLKLTLTKNGVYQINAGSPLSELLTVEGAQIRTSGIQGLRFVANYNLAIDSSIAVQEYGFVVLPTDILNGSELTAGTTYTYNGNNYDSGVVKADKLYAEGEGYKQYTVCITGIDSTKYTRDYTVRTYVKTADGYIYGQSYNTSIYAVAKAALADDASGKTPLTADVKAVMQGIVDSVDN